METALDPLPFKNPLLHLCDAKMPAHISDHQALLICTSSVQPLRGCKHKRCVTRITVYAALPGRFPFLSQVSKGSEEAFLLAIRPVVLNLKGWIVIYTMYVNFMRLRLSNVFFSKGLN